MNIVLWLLVLVGLGIVGSASCYFLTQAAQSLLMLAILALIIVFVVYPLTLIFLKKLKQRLLGIAEQKPSKKRVR